MKQTIWSNDLSLKDYKEWLEAYKEWLMDNNDDIDEDEMECIDIDDYAFSEWLYETLDMYIYDERINLDIQTDNTLIALAEMGLWNGKRYGYKLIDDDNIKNTLYSDCDLCSWYLDRYNFRSVQKHHDGTNYIMYRELKDDKYLDIVTNKAYMGTLTDKDISRYTKSIKPLINKIYG